jgi:hypothetical protein
MRPNVDCEGLPVAKGARDALENLVTAGEACNLGKGTRD